MSAIASFRALLEPCPAQPHQACTSSRSTCSAAAVSDTNSLSPSTLHRGWLCRQQQAEQTPQGSHKVLYCGRSCGQHSPPPPPEHSCQGRVRHAPPLQQSDLGVHRTPLELALDVLQGVTDSIWRCRRQDAQQAQAAQLARQSFCHGSTASSGNRQNPVITPCAQMR